METQERSLSPRSIQRIEWVCLAAAALAVVAGLLLRFWDLGDKPFWVGEVQEIVNARQHRIIMRINEAATDLVGFLWHHLVWRLGVTDSLEFWHRFLSALCGAATIPALFWLGKRAHSARVGAAAALLLAFSFFHIYHSQDARALSYMTFGITLTHLGLIKVVFDRSWRWTPAVLVGALFLGCSHIFGFISFVLLCLVFFAVTLFIEHSRHRDRNDRLVTRFLLVLLPAVFLAAWQAWGSILFIFFKGDDMGGGCPDGVTFAQRLRFFSVLFTYYGGMPGIGWMLTAALALVGAPVLWWKERKVAVVLLAWFFIPAALLTAGKLTGRLQRLDIYHLLHLQPVVLLLVSAGLDALVRALFAALGRKMAQTAATVCVLGLALLMAVGFNLDTWTRYQVRETRLFVGHDFRSVATFLDNQEIGDHDILAFDYSIQFVLANFYLGRHFHDKRGLTPFKPDGQLFEESSRQFKLRLMFHSGDMLYNGDIPLLASQRVSTLDDWLSSPGSAGFQPASYSSYPGSAGFQPASYSSYPGSAGFQPASYSSYPGSAGFQPASYSSYPGSAGFQPASYSGTIWLIFPHEENMEEICGISAYSKWFSSDDIYIDVGVIPQNDLPDGFQLKRFAGVDLVWKTYAKTPRTQVVAQIKPLLIGYAPTMADAFFREFRPSLSDPRERGLK